MKTQIYFMLKKYFPYFAKYLFAYFKKHDFDFKEVKKHLSDDIHKLIVDELEKLIVDNPDGYLGAILDENENENEYFLGAEAGEVEIYENPNKAVFELNQLEFKNTFGSCLCTMYGALGVACDNTGLELTRDERYKLAELRYNASDFQPKLGGYISVGNDITRKYFKDELDIDLIMYKFTKDSKVFWDYLNNDWRLNIGFRGTRELVVDMADGSIDNAITGKEIYGHSTTIRKIAGGMEIQLIDSYNGVKKYNAYNFKNFEEFIKSPFVFGNVRVLVPVKQKSLLDLPSSVITNKLGNYNGQNANNPATRFEAASMAGGNTKKVLKLLLDKKVITRKDLEKLVD